MHHNTTRHIIITLLCLALLATSTLAVGISIPRQYVWDFKPFMERRVEYKIINSYMKPVDVEILPEGNLLPYGNISTLKLSLAPKEVKMIHVWFKLPEKLDSGRHELRFSVRELPPEGSWLSATAAVTVYLAVDVPYPNKFITASINVPHSEVNTTILANITAQNLGLVPINDAYAHVSFMDDNKSITYSTATTNHETIIHGKPVLLQAAWNGNPPPGIYMARATIHADENTTTVQTPFIVGEQDIEIVTITKHLNAGKVNPLSFTLLNRWNQPIYNAHVKIHAGDDTPYDWIAQGAPLTIYPWQTNSQEYYMNVPETRLTTIDGFVDLIFNGKTKRVPLTFTITPSPETQSPAAAPTLWTMRLLFVLLLGTIIFIYLKRRKKEKPQ